MIKMTYGEMKATGVFETMPNGFNLYLDDDRFDDAVKAMLVYNAETGYYDNVEFDISLSIEEIENYIVTYITSDPTGDFVPAVYIKKNDIVTLQFAIDMDSKILKSDNLTVKKMEDYFITAVRFSNALVIDKDTSTGFKEGKLYDPDKLKVTNVKAENGQIKMTVDASDDALSIANLF